MATAKKSNKAIDKKRIFNRIMKKQKMAFQIFRFDVGDSYKFTESLFLGGKCSIITLTKCYPGMYAER